MRTKDDEAREYFGLKRAEEAEAAFRDSLTDEQRALFDRFDSVPTPGEFFSHDIFLEYFWRAVLPFVRNGVAECSVKDIVDRLRKNGDSCRDWRNVNRHLAMLEHKGYLDSLHYDPRYNGVRFYRLLPTANGKTN